MDWYLAHFAGRIPHNNKNDAIPVAELGMIAPIIDSIPDGHILAIDFCYIQPEKNEHILIGRTKTDSTGAPILYALICPEKPPVTIWNEKVIVQNKHLSWGRPFLVDTITDALVAHRINEVANSPYGNLYEAPTIGMRLLNPQTDSIQDIDPDTTALPAIMQQIDAIHANNGLSFQRWRHRAGQRDSVCQFAPSATPFGRPL